MPQLYRDIKLESWQVLCQRPSNLHGWDQQTQAHSKSEIRGSLPRGIFKLTTSPILPSPILLSPIHQNSQRLLQWPWELDQQYEVKSSRVWPYILAEMTKFSSLGFGIRETKRQRGIYIYTFIKRAGSYSCLLLSVLDFVLDFFAFCRGILFFCHWQNWKPKIEGMNRNWLFSYIYRYRYRYDILCDKLSYYHEAFVLRLSLFMMWRGLVFVVLKG